MSYNSLPQTPLMNALNSGPQMNVKRNIINGPGPGQYWNHSPGLEAPLIREEGPLPIQGNIGSLLAQESNNFASCGSGPNIGGSPNCTSMNSFRSDIYTKSDTCGSNCTLTYPESFGGNSFGLDKSALATDSHALHAYKNIRAGTEGSNQSQVYGCYEWVPTLQKTGDGSCKIDPNPAYQMVGDWTKLPNAKTDLLNSVVGYNWK